jgi:class 3 adenylate cyclase
MIEQSRKSFDTYLERNSSDLSTAIHDLWQQRDPTAWAKDPYFYTRLGEIADKLGQTMFAYDVLEEALKGTRQVAGGAKGASQQDLRLTQLYCLSLIKCGYLLKARDLLSNLVRQGHLDEETLGILGRVYKEMWLIEGEGARDHPYLKKSRSLYLEAFNRSRGNYSGINAASLSLILEDGLTARKLARQVIKICGDRLRRQGSRDYWTLATLGEGFILLERQQEAAKYYGLARRVCGRNYANLASSKRQLRLLSRYTQVQEAVMATLLIPPVAAFTGHMLDAPGRRPPRFPPRAAPAVKAGIRSVLDLLDVGIGYSSAACGGDVLFLECLQARGGECNVVLPFVQEDFFATSVEFAGPEWVQRARRVLQHVAGKEEAEQGRYLGDDLPFFYANLSIMGKAILRSRLLETDAHLIAVWDGRSSGATGGSAEFIAIWESLALPFTIIESRTGAVLPPGRREARVRSVRMRPRPSARDFRTTAGKVGREIVAILFADLVGYSRLQEEQIPSYIEGFLGSVARRLRKSRHKPVFSNIWGDAICFIFADLLGAAEYAMELRDVLRETDWPALGLPADLSIRIGLHAGPAYFAREPLLQRLNFFGSHVNQAARIEPITSPGNVYASEQFAALLLTDRRNRLDCRYVGVIVLPKEFGNYPIYHIRRKNEIC